jgi:tripartite-type tricarboxylate transporter receptor subunit TctC
LEVLPDVPTVRQFVPGYEVSGWFGVGAPKNPAAEIVEGLNKEINAGLGDPEIKERLTFAHFSVSAAMCLPKCQHQARAS